MMRVIFKTWVDIKAALNLRQTVLMCGNYSRIVVPGYAKLLEDLIPSSHDLVPENHALVIQIVFLRGVAKQLWARC